ncbi:hypothetical protein [Nonomuraea sp. NPDC049504]|uniref:hypothetical protein n=1 Tax=Nonomuraea sp. NPDC049504 TaxID=3154729 RepID=UPI00343C6F9F
MWRTLSDDARQAIRDLCDKHGARLYDYCRTELAAGDAEQAVAGAAMTAHLYADRVVDPALRRPWLYAVARAHRAFVASPASIGSWSRPGRMSELLPEALLSLERPQRELLDLSVRHGLSDPELAAIFELPAAEVHAIVTRAASGLEEWFAAIVAARSPDGCPDLTARMEAWVAAPGRRARARIGRHIQACATCRAAPRTMTAAALLRRLPIATLPGTLPNRLASAQPLPGEGPLWRADGFPVQARTLVETSSSQAPPAADAMPSAPVAGPTTATPGKPWSEAGAAASDQEPPTIPAARLPLESLPRPMSMPLAAPTYAEYDTEDEAPEEPIAAPAVRGRHPFTPPSRTRAFRGGVAGDKLVYRTALKGESNGVPHDAPVIRYGGITASNTVSNTASNTVSNFVQPPGGGDGGQWQEYWREPPDDDPEQGTPIRAVARLALILGVGLLAVGLIWAIMNGQAGTPALTKAAAQSSADPEAPSGAQAGAGSEAESGPRSSAQPDEPAREASGSDAAEREASEREASEREASGRETSGREASGGGAEESAGSGLKAVPRKSALPKPAAPVAELSPSSAWLGERRTGSFALACTGRCQVVSAAGTAGIAVSGTRFRVADRLESCDPAPAVRRGKITVKWAGTAKGDGERTGGTTTASGTLTMNVTWTPSPDASCG